MLDKKNIESYINQLRSEEKAFSQSNDMPSDSAEVAHSSLVSKSGAFFFIIRSLTDFIILKFRLFFKSYRNKHIVYTSYNFTTTVNGQVEDRMVRPLFTKNILFINQSKEVYMSKVNNQKVYNVGGVAKLIALCSKEKSSMMRNFEGHQKVNKWLLNTFSNKEIYLMYYYELNSLSIIFSNFRHKLKLIEVQHGSIINYPPYSKPSPVKLIDLFYVKNEQTITYLQQHLCLNYDTQYKLLPSQNIHKTHNEGIHILYASNIEYKGLHPVFANFLQNTKLSNLHIKIRLHPREQNQAIQEIFVEQMQKLGHDFEFDQSKNWLESNTIANLIVISPLSSILEEAADNDINAITIDSIGAKRFDFLIKEFKLMYTNHLTDAFIKTI